MKYYRCLTKEEFENLEEGTTVEFLTVKYSKIFNGKITHDWVWEEHTFYKKDLLNIKPNYFQYGKFRLLLGESDYPSVMDEMIEEITEVITNETRSN